MAAETADKDNKDDVKKENDEEMIDDDNAPKGKKEEKPKKKKYTDWPLKDIKEPHDHDVLYGRGGGTNHHAGNKRYRKMVEERKMDYVNSKRLDKPLVALEIIRQWRDQDPPGRFLKVEDRSGLWQDVGDKKAREKTSQALREKAPQLRKQQEDEQNGSGSDEDASKSPAKTTRFAAGTNQQKSGPKKALLARDHSLGREYIEPGDAVTLEGFSWQDPLQDMYPGRTNSQGSMPGRVNSQGSMPGRINSQGSMPQDAPWPPGYYPPGRMNSQGSMGAPPHYHQSHGSSHYRTMSEDRQSRYTSSGRFESWGQTPMSSMGSNGPPMPPPPVPGYGAPYMHQRSGSWGPSSGSWGPPPMARDHSLCMHPLRDATTSEAAMQFESGRAGSGYWAEVPPPVPQPRGGSGGGPPPPPPQQFQPPRTSSGQQQQQPMNRSSPTRAPPSPTRAPPPPPSYEVDPSIAQTWSTQSDDYEKVAGMMQYEVQRTWSGEEFRGGRNKPHRSSAPAKQQHTRGDLARPSIVKRATSNQNETVETKPDLRGPSVKRAALNRDNSMVANRLKAEYAMNTATLKEETPSFDSDKEVRNLSGTLAEASLEIEETTKTRPKPLSETERVSTFDKIAMDLMVQPEPLGSRGRSSTIEALNLDFEDDQILRPIELDRMSSLNSVFSSFPMDGDEEPLARPPPMNREVSVSDWLNDV